MADGLIDGLRTTDALSDAFSDRAVIAAMLGFEVALARAESREGLIPDTVAATIAAVHVEEFDVPALLDGQRQTGTFVIPFVKQLTELVRRRDPVSAGYVHWGATSQDVADTAIVLCVSRARGALEADHRELLAALRATSDRYRDTVMLGRTLLQPAPPVTLGLKAAGWLGSVRRSWRSVSAACDAALVVQFGGASGTLAALESRGPDVASALAHELGLPNPGAPWHAHRDRLATMVAACGVYVGALGKVARDVSLLMQFEVGEVFERGGGSSAMPQKRNPSGSAVVLAAADRMPGLVASYLSAIVHEHERAVGGWHAEAPIIADVIQTTGAATGALRGVVAGLTVDEARMRANIEATRGNVFAERAVMLAGRSIGRDEAHRLVSEAVRRSEASGASLQQAIAETPELRRAIGAELDSLARAEQYLGAAESFRLHLLDESE